MPIVTPEGPELLSLLCVFVKNDIGEVAVLAGIESVPIVTLALNGKPDAPVLDTLVLITTVLGAEALAPSPVLELFGIEFEIVKGLMTVLLVAAEAGSADGLLELPLGKRAVAVEVFVLGTLLVNVALLAPAAVLRVLGDIPKLPLSPDCVVFPARIT